MPIPKDRRPLYRGIVYRVWRAALLDRAAGNCEQCRKPNGARIETITALDILGVRMAWRFDPRFPWRDQFGKPIRRLTVLQVLRKLRKQARDIVVVVTAVRIGRAGGKMLCQWCSLQETASTRLAHARETRINAKDGGRALLEGDTAQMSSIPGGLPG